ncbi:ComEC/Rec2 family competence protein [Paenibacillus sp. JJ-223]|uniref:ComEC/Rec2 family competence protein n=1 Tax=Paenibacillus sp. JJ-223 TaxID=2905647 RepID=UPI001F1A87A2|nr:ComEC/Rec2 family competence protein [Paenibacillus sp. JJ-223]CAH1226582.1 hypothetical protein PAECIP111890_05974 [Paenibacillus sp. JJ-223]
MKGRPLLGFTVCWLCGSGMAVALSGWNLLWGMVGVLACAPLWLRWLGLRGWIVILFGAAFASGAVHWEWNDTRNVSHLAELTGMASDELDGVEATVQGRLDSEVRIDGDRADFELQVSSVQIDPGASASGGFQPLTLDHRKEKFMVQVRLAKEEELQTAAAWQRGDTVTLEGTLALPGEARNYDGFDYRAYLRTLEIHWLFKVKGAIAVEAVPAEGWKAFNLFRLNDQARSKLGSAVDRLFPEPHGGYMKGLIIGMAKDIDPDTYGGFSQLGLTHILAISGTHVAVYVSSLLLLMSLLRLTRETSLTIVLLLVPFYVMLSGGSPSVVRAGIMSMIGLTMARKGLPRDGLHIISAAALLMMWWNPYFMVNVSFQLSFLVTAGLMIYMPLIHRLFDRWPKALAATASVTVTAQLISFPVTILYFNQFSILSFVANFLLVSFISVIVLPLGTVALIIGFVWFPAAKLLAWITIVLNDLTFATVEWMNRFPGFVLIWPTPPIWWIAAYYIGLYSLLRLLQKGNLGKKALPFPQLQDDTAPLSRRPDVIPSSADRTSYDVGRTPQPGYSDQVPCVSDVSGQSVALLSASIAWPEYSGAFTSRGAGFYDGEKRSPYHGWICGLIAISLIAGLWWGYQSPYPSGTGVVQFLDVGQGDSALISTPGGKHILVDGGGTVSFAKPDEGWRVRRDPYEVGAKVVVPLLKKRGIHELDAIIVTHADQDHAGGLQAVLEQIPVKRLVFNGTTSGKDNFDKLLQTAADRQIPLYAVRQGMTYKADDQTRLYFLSPDLSPSTDRLNGMPVDEEQNHHSVVFLLEMAGASLLFTGDMDAAAEQDVLFRIQDGSLAEAFAQEALRGNEKPSAALQAQLPLFLRSEQATQNPGVDDAVDNMTMSMMNHRVDVLKVAHHGSKTSSAEGWLHYWNASSAVISAGVNNLYGHPNAGVVERLEQSGSAIYRTDQMGEVQMRIKAGHIEIRHKLESD